MPGDVTPESLLMADGTFELRTPFFNVMSFLVRACCAPRSCTDAICRSPTFISRGKREVFAGLSLLNRRLNSGNFRARWRSERTVSP